MTSLNPNFVKTTFPQCDKFIQQNNFCCGDEKTNTEFLNKECNPYQNVTKKAEFADLVFNILRHSRLIYDILWLRKWPKNYFNNDKFFCSTINLNQIMGGSGKMKVYSLDELCVRTPNADFNKITSVKRLNPRGRIQCATKDKAFLKQRFPLSDLLCPVIQVPLTDNEKILAYYMLKGDFLLNVLYSLKNSIYQYAKHKFYCKVFTVPAKFSSNGKSYKIKLTGKELKMLYCLYLRHQGRPQNNKLPYFP